MSSRSTPFTSKLVFAALALGVSASLAAGCSTQTADSASRESAAPPLNDDQGSSGATTLPTVDAAAPQASPYRGNPLCYVGSNEDCMPDDDAYHRTSGTAECATPPPDAGDAGNAGAADGYGCRIGRDAKTGDIATTCEKTTSPAGGDGTTCETGADCAAGFDCIAGEKGKACRHYCCAGTCKDRLSQSGGATFCDVQSLVDVNQKAPVCMPLKRCKLLGTGECASERVMRGRHRGRRHRMRDGRRAAGRRGVRRRITAPRISRASARRAHASASSCARSNSNDCGASRDLRHEHGLQGPELRHLPEALTAARAVLGQAPIWPGHPETARNPAERLARAVGIPLATAARMAKLSVDVEDWPGEALVAAVLATGPFDGARARASLRGRCRRPL